MAKRITIIKTTTHDNFTYLVGNTYDVLLSFGKKLIRENKAVAAEPEQITLLSTLDAQEKAALQDLENEYPISDDAAADVLEDTPKEDNPKKAKRNFKLL